MKHELHIDIDECPDTGELIDYILVDDHRNVIARLGASHTKDKAEFLDFLGILAPWGGCRGEAVILLTGEEAKP